MMFLTLVSSRISCTGGNGLTDCSADAQESVHVHLDSALGSGTFYTGCYHQTPEYELGLADHIDSNKFSQLSQAIESIVHVGRATEQDNLAFTIYIKGALHQDSSVGVNHVHAIGRYYLRDHHLYHELFVKRSGGRFRELEDVGGEVDGVIFNYMTMIDTAVLKMPAPSSVLFIEREHPKGLYAMLLEHHDAVRAKLEGYREWEDGTRR